MGTGWPAEGRALAIGAVVQKLQVVVQETMEWVTQHGMMVRLDPVKLPMMEPKMSWEMLSMMVDFHVWSSNIQNLAGLE
jgi:hypothetical protein